MNLRVAALHHTPDLRDLAASQRALLAQAAEAFESAELVVLPELPWGPFLLDRPAAEQFAEPLDGPTVAALVKLARGKGAVVSGLVLREGQQLFNAQVVVDRDGTLAVYRKHHLWGPDHLWATAGPTPGAVVETSLGRVGLLICHDVVYVETVAAVVRQRPDVLAFSTAWVGDGVLIPGWWIAATLQLRGAPLVAANRGGSEGPFEFADPSAVLHHDRASNRILGRAGPRGEAGYTVSGSG